MHQEITDIWTEEIDPITEKEKLNFFTRIYMFFCFIRKNE